MKYDEGKNVRCAYESSGATDIRPEELRPLLTKKTVSGRALTARYQQSMLRQRVPLVRLISIVHLVAVRNPHTGALTEPIVDQTWVDNLYAGANRIWRQACLKLLPYSANGLVTTFHDLAILGFAGSCLAPAERKLVEPYDITVPDTLNADGTLRHVTMINVYLVEDTNDASACGSPITGHVILPTQGLSPDVLAQVFAHEIGHVLLNPLGVDDSANPDHLMFHPEAHPGSPAGSGDGLLLSDCVGAHTRAREDLAGFVEPGVPGSGQDGGTACLWNPRLGGNVIIVATEPGGVKD